MLEIGFISALLILIGAIIAPVFTLSLVCLFTGNYTTGFLLLIISLLKTEK